MKPNNYEAEFCGRVPLHQTNLIQPHGVLLIIDRKDFRILQASENAIDIFNAEAKELISQSLLRFIPQEQGEKLKERFEKKLEGKLPFNFTFPRGQHLALIQPAEYYFIVEIDRENRSQDASESFLSIYEDLKFAMTAVEGTGSVEETCRVAASELKRISGFDKIMIYQFDEEWNGDVIAEIKEEGMDSYLGLKFPASDIPKQARELYRRTTYRLIPNIHYEAVRLYPVLNPLTNAFTDLSNTNLRSVAAVHLEYLGNMNVVASMSTRILVDGRLWGLIACHHRTAKYLSYELCSVFELLSTVISARITLVKNIDVFNFKESRRALHSQMVQEFYRQDNLQLSFARHGDDLLQLLSAEGVSFVANGRIESFGKVPGNQQVEELVLWIRSAGIKTTTQYPALGSAFEPAFHYSQIASGVLVLPIQVETSSFILAFRPEAVQTVDWGGNPNDAVQFEPGGNHYHPRNSFRQWQQTVGQRSLPWKEEEIEVAEKLRGFIVEFVLNKIYT